MKVTVSLIATAAMIGSAFAGESVVSSKKYQSTEMDCFNAQEFQIDVFGQYTDGNGDHHAGNIREHGWGGGLGINYFITRNFGIGVDAAWLKAKEAPYIEDVGSGRNDVFNISASLIYRFPFEGTCFAPYLFGGGGVSIDGEQWATAHAGLGVEYRVVPNRIGLFADARYTYLGDRFGHGDLGNASARAGVRFIF